MMKKLKISLQQLQQVTNKINNKQVLQNIKGGFIGITDLRDGA